MKKLKAIQLQEVNLNEELSNEKKAAFFKQRDEKINYIRRM